MIDQGPTPEMLSGDLRKYNGEPVAEILVKPDSGPSKLGRKRGPGKKAGTAPP